MTTQTALDNIAPDNLVMLNGSQLLEMPDNLYIPPAALRVILSSFEGPLDLLWYLIKRQNIDILDIPVAQVAEQYVAYIEIMQDLELDFISDYLVMAAMLAEIKSRMLLPKAASDDEEEDDPRAELIKKLQEYEKFKMLAEQLDDLPRQDRDTFVASQKTDTVNIKHVEPELQLSQLLTAFEKIMKRTKANKHHLIQAEPMSIREKMVHVLAEIPTEGFAVFENLFSKQEGKIGIVVTFLAILELIKQNMLKILQTESFAPIHLTRV